MPCGPMVMVSSEHGLYPIPTHVRLVQDLHEPSSKQVRRHLLDIINFARFCEWQEGKANAMEEEVIAMVDQNEELEERRNQLRREVELACADHDDREAVRTFQNSFVCSLHALWQGSVCMDPGTYVRLLL